MKTLNEHIKNGTFQKVYLITGPEDYLRKQYRDRIKDAITGDDTFNYNYYEGKGIDVNGIIDMSETLPFFAEKRLIVVENSGFFSSSQDALSTYMAQIPESTCIVFVEKEADKRGKLYKAVSKNGYVANMTAPNEKMLMTWIAGILKKEKRLMTRDTVTYFLGRIDTQMDNIRHELDKLILYTEDGMEITAADVDAVCTVFTESKVFDMVDAVAVKDRKKALELYYDLLSQKEPPMRILYWLTRQYNQLFMIREQMGKGYPDSVIADRLAIRDFVVRKNRRLCERYQTEELHKALALCVARDADIKTGRMNDRLAVETLIFELS